MNIYGSNSIREIIVASKLLSSLYNARQGGIDNAVTKIITAKAKKQEAISNAPNSKKSIAEALDNLYNVAGIIKLEHKTKVTMKGTKYLPRFWITDLNRPFILPPSKSVIEQKLDELKKMINASDLVSCIKQEYEVLFHKKFADIQEGAITKYHILFD